MPGNSESSMSKTPCDVNKRLKLGERNSMTEGTQLHVATRGSGMSGRKITKAAAPSPLLQVQ